MPDALVATAIHTETEEARLKRRNRLPCITVKCNPRGGATAAEARLRVRDRLEALGAELPAGYSCEWGGEYESSSNANAGLKSILGMMPLVADAFYAAMAVTIMCGLAFATVLTMVVIPVNYALVYGIRR